MGIHRGPNIIKDNLVFGYDTGYGVADNNTATRFYQGMPTTNLNADPYHSTKSAGDTVTLAAWGGDTGQGSFEVNTSPAGGGMMFINHNTSNPAGTGGTYTDFPTTRYTLTNGVTYTRSWWAKADDTRSASGHICSCNRDSTNTYIVGNSVSLTTEWQRYSHTFTYTGPTSSDWQFRHIIYDASKVYIANVQLEEGSVVSPPLSGTRSSTQSLIDLKRTTSIDVSNVSFDSTGQPDYDGTNDYLRQTLTGVDLNSGCAIEGVLRRNTTPSAWRTFFNIKPSGANTPFFEFRSNANAQHIYADYYNGSADYNTPSADLTLGDFGHAVACYDGNGTIKMYLNGSLVGTKTGVPGFALGTNPVISVGIAYSNNRYTDISAPVVKVYNSPLSAAQIQQNYNAYKNRFNI